MLQSEVTTARWPNGVRCPRCESAEIGEISTRQLFVCRKCRKQFSARVGTIFEDSALPLSAWLSAIETIESVTNVILAVSLGVTQKTAWLMQHRIRVAMRTQSFLLSKGTLLERILRVPKREADRRLRAERKAKAKRRKSNQ